MTALVTEAVVDSIAQGLGDSLGMAVVVSLIIFLVARELASASEGHKFKILSERTLIAIVPLLIVFSLIVVVEIVEVLA